MNAGRLSNKFAFKTCGCKKVPKHCNTPGMASYQQETSWTRARIGLAWLANIIITGVWQQIGTLRGQAAMNALRGQAAMNARRGQAAMNELRGQAAMSSPGTLGRSRCATRTRCQMPLMACRSPGMCTKAGEMVSQKQDGTRANGTIGTGIANIKATIKARQQTNDDSEGAGLARSTGSAARPR